MHHVIQQLPDCLLGQCPRGGIGVIRRINGLWLTQASRTQGNSIANHWPATQMPARLGLCKDTSDVAVRVSDLCKHQWCRQLSHRGVGPLTTVSAASNFLATAMEAVMKVSAVSWKRERAGPGICVNGTKQSKANQALGQMHVWCSSGLCCTTPHRGQTERGSFLHSRLPNASPGISQDDNELFFF